MSKYITKYFKGQKVIFALKLIYYMKYLNINDTLCYYEGIFCMVSSQVFY